uniref:Uncharacterized protein n=1 Tax=viral metagenome TaxID=1070528 RepID=A0A6C0F7U8_9ZZZZ|tara:strand:- start:22996 stop:23622 length:627 start_codon:yes stop_codon:yes gene_type:complete
MDKRLEIFIPNLNSKKSIIVYLHENKVNKQSIFDTKENKHNDINPVDFLIYLIENKYKNIQKLKITAHSEGTLILHKLLSKLKTKTLNKITHINTYNSKKLLPLSQNSFLNNFAYLSNLKTANIRNIFTRVPKSIQILLNNPKISKTCKSLRNTKICILKVRNINYLIKINDNKYIMKKYSERVKKYDYKCKVKSNKVICYHKKSKKP